jgi:hypothetical protein
VQGTDLGVNYYVLPKVELRANLSTVELKDVSVVGEATSLNSPNTKWTLGATARDVGRFTVGSTWRNVNGYYFRSGVNTGVIPTFGALDANVSVRLPALRSTLFNVGVSNLFSCTGQNIRYRTPAVTAPAVAQPNSVIDSEDRKCGFNRKHIEMINMPEIGTMLFAGVRLER